MLVVRAYMSNSSSSIITVQQHIMREQKRFPGASGEFSFLLSGITLATKMIQAQVRRAGLTDVLGEHGDINVQGEVQQKLDILSNEALVHCLSARESIGVLASEENENPMIVHEGSEEAKYAVVFDPLDGSSNIDVNVSVGTIFSIYRRVTAVGTPVLEEDFLQKGSEQVAAGYIIYGTSTMLVYTTGDGVNGFTLNPAIGTFYLSHPQMQFPKQGTIYSVNEGNYIHFPQGIKNYIKYCQMEEEDRPYTSRYIGSLVSDFHRNMIKGGIYLYPPSSKNPNGKLRLLYECNPMAFIAEQASGKASDGIQRILDIQPTELHQRVPFVCGSSTMVDKVEDFMRASLKV